MSPSVTVIVPCFEELPFIERCLDSILRSKYSVDRLEVIVADGMSLDGTRDVLERMAARDTRLRVIDNPARITPAALNRAIGASSGEIVVRFDAHALMPADYIRRCVDLLESSHADNAGGAIRTVAQSSGPFAEAIVAALSSRFGVGNSAFRTSAGEGGARSADTVFGGCWRRELFDRIGGFNERLARSQDIEFNLRIVRAGGAIVLDPEIVCDYYARSTLGSFWRHNFSNGAWAVLPFALSDILPVRLRHLIPLAFVVSLAASILLRFPWSIGVLSAYAAVNFAASVQIALERRQGMLLALLPIAFATLHVGYGVGSVWGCLRVAARFLRGDRALLFKARREAS